MSHSAAAAHGHDDHAADHGSLKSYIIGFVLSLLLTFGSFGLVMHGALSHTITIVGIDEFDPLNGKISWVSPMARTITKAREGDVITLNTPLGEQELELLEVTYPAPGEG